MVGRQVEIVLGQIAVLPAMVEQRRSGIRVEDEIAEFVRVDLVAQVDGLLHLLSNMREAIALPNVPKGSISVFIYE